MRLICVAFCITMLIIVFPGACVADGPPASADGKLFGLAAPTGSFADAAVTSAYEKSGATAVVLDVAWGKIEPNDPASGESKYDFSSFDAAPLAKSSKTRICWISLANPWAGKVRVSDPDRYWNQVKKFVAEFARHANAMGIKHFAYRIEQDNPLSSVGPVAANAEPLKHIYQVVKDIAQDNIVIAEQPYGSGGNAIGILYRTGAKGSFDVAAVSAIPATGSGVDAFKVVEAYRQMARNGDGSKRLLIIDGFISKNADSEISWQTIADTVSDDIRSILTERDIYDPSWVLGEIVRLPARPSAGFVAEFPPRMPLVKLQPQISANVPIFNYVTERPYKLTLTLTNFGLDEMKLGKFSFAILGDKDLAVDVKSEGKAPEAIAAGATATADFTFILPKATAGKQITLASMVDYTAGGKNNAADCWLTIMPTLQYEVTVLPPRLIIDPREGSKRVGMSVINHADTEFDGKIVLSAYPGITVTPTELTTKIDALGLEAFTYSVSVDEKTAPGHYAVFVDVGDKAREWQAVDVAIVAKKATGKIAMDGKLDECKDASSFTIRTAGDGTAQGMPVGKGWIAHDDSGLYLAVQLDETKPKKAASASELAQASSVTVSLDPLVNGARTAAGGYLEDDYEFRAGDTQKGPAVVQTQAPGAKALGAAKNMPFAFRSNDGKSTYEVMFPWAEIAPLCSNTVDAFAIAVTVYTGEGQQAGSFGTRTDPRQFMPVVLAR